MRWGLTGHYCDFYQDKFSSRQKNSIQRNCCFELYDHRLQSSENNGEMLFIIFPYHTQKKIYVKFAGLFAVDLLDFHWRCHEKKKFV